MKKQFNYVVYVKFSAQGRYSKLLWKFLYFTAHMTQLLNHPRLLCCPPLQRKKVLRGPLRTIGMTTVAFCLLFILTHCPDSGRGFDWSDLLITKNLEITKSSYTVPLSSNKYEKMRDSKFFVTYKNNPIVEI